LQLETLANEFRSDRLAWKVILDEKLYQEPRLLDDSRLDIRHSIRKRLLPARRLICWSDSQLDFMSTLCRER